ncbi:MAG: TRZ/ATZ family protein [Clostridiales bacterium]|jgi:fumarate hydratase subunit beta|nr:TRZ/ATZ family protein [Clostridiales bacterium]
MKAFMTVGELIKNSPILKAGDEITLSGVVYTARDAAHKKMAEIIKKGEKPPFELQDAVIYYAGPTPPKPGEVCGSFGPTTSARMDGFAPLLYEKGVFATIGKGERSGQVRQAIIKRKGLYLIALGGAGALAAKHIKSVKVIAFEELDSESVKEIIFEDFPLYVGIDIHGNDIYKGN